MAPEGYVLIAAIVGGLIGFISSFFTTLLTQRYQEAKRKEEREWYLADQQREIRFEILNRRYDEAESLITFGMEEILKIAKMIHSAAASKDMETKRTRQAELFQFSEGWDQVEEFEQLHTIVHAIGDSELIDSVINLHITYTSFLEWTEKSILADLELDDSLPITRSKLNKVDDFRMEAFEYYANFYRRLDTLRSGADPEKWPAQGKKQSSISSSTNRIRKEKD
ncbi:MAG: hypothetical protein ACK2UM_04020 [Anaerolineales bacterium]|jgi:hypothetical protein